MTGSLDSITPSSSFFVAELGFNHRGSVEKASLMIGQADEAGDDCVPVLLYRTDHLVSGVYCEERVPLLRSHQLTGGNLIGERFGK